MSILKKEICKKCFIERSMRKYYEKQMSKGRWMKEQWEVTFEQVWENGRVLCEHDKARMIADGIYSECPYILEQSI